MTAVLALNRAIEAGLLTMTPLVVLAAVLAWGVWRQNR
jgi:hypothetical protein